MSRKRKRQNKKSFLPWLVAAGGILLVVAVFLLARQNGGGGGAPIITVDQQRIDYGDVKFNTNKNFAIIVTNLGDDTLRFKEEPYIQVLEGC